MSLCGDPIYGDGLNVGTEESLPPLVPLSDKVHQNKIVHLRASDTNNVCSSGVGLPTFPVAPPVPLGEGLGETEGGGLGGGNLSSSSAASVFDSGDSLFSDNEVIDSEKFKLGALFAGVSTTCGHPDYSKAK